MSHTNSTPNYALPEFLSSDKPAWMADINVAFSNIDTAMKNNEDSAAQANTDIGTIGLNFAPGYSNASTYDVGDVVVYNKRMWICDIAVTAPEAFDSGKWSYYRVSDTEDAVANVSAAENALKDVVGNTDISQIGDGTCTGAIDTINANLSWKSVANITDVPDTANSILLTFKTSFNSIQTIEVPYSKLPCMVGPLLSFYNSSSSYGYMNASISTTSVSVTNYYTGGVTATLDDICYK